MRALFLKYNCLIIFFSLVICIKSFGQNKRIDSLSTQLKSVRHDTAKISLLNAIATEYSLRNEHDQCYKVIQEVLSCIALANKKFSEKTILKKLDTEKAVAYNLLGIRSYRQGNYTDAVKNYELSLNAFDKTGNQKRVAVALSNIGVIYYSQGNYAKALEYYFRSLKIREKISDKAGMASVLSNIGIVYEPLLDYKKSIEYQEKALELVKGTGNILSEASCINNLGKVYWRKNDLRTAISHFSTALALYDSINDLAGKSAALGNIGVIYCELREYDKAMSHCVQALAINQSLGHKRGIAISFNNIGNTYYQQKQFAKAASFFKKGLDISKEIGVLELIQEAESNMYHCYEQLGDTKNALRHYKNYTAAKDSLFSEHNNEKILRIQNNFEIERREQKISLLEKNKLIGEIELQKKQQEITLQKKSSTLLIAFCILLLLFLIVLVVVYIRTIKTGKLLASKNEEIHRQKIAELLREQNMRSIQQLLKGQETERRRIAKDLHDGVGGTLAGIKLKLHKLAETMDENAEIKTLTRNIETAYDEIRTISHNLTPPQLQQSVFTDAIHNLVREMETSSHLKIKLECVSQDELNALHENIQVEIYRILQELLKNVLVHASASEVIVDLIKSENELTLLVEDNGKGYSVPLKIAGIGLQNIKNRVESLNGSFSIDSQLSRGTAVNINIAC